MSSKQDHTHGKDTELRRIINQYKESPTNVSAQIKQIYPFITSPTDTQKEQTILIKEQVEEIFQRILEDEYVNNLQIESLTLLQENHLKNNNKSIASNFGKLLEAAIQCALDRTSDASLPFTLLGDLLELTTINICEEIFSFVEKHADTFKRPELLLQKYKNTGIINKFKLIEICVKLLRRLSRMDNVVFCGRIHILLSYILSIDDRGGLNLANEYNLSNTTFIEEDSPQTDPSVVDYTFYKQFWDLQSFCREPQLLYDEQKWKYFETIVNEILKTFEVYTNVSTKSSKKSDDDKMDVDNSSQFIVINEEDFFVPKYLTSRKLLHLQLSDVKFRTQIMIQLFMLFQNFETPLRKTSKRLPTENMNAINTWKNKMNHILSKYGNGIDVTKLLNTAMSRENNWVLWKKTSCKEKLIRVLSDEEKSKLIEPKLETPRYLMGSKELAELWKNQEPVEEYIKKKDTPLSVPSYDEFLNRLKEQLDPSSGIEPEYSLAKNKIYSWKLFRYQAKMNMEQFHHSMDVIVKQNAGQEDKMDESPFEQSAPSTPQQGEQLVNGIQEEAPPPQPPIPSPPREEPPARSVEENTQKQEEKIERRLKRRESTPETKVTPPPERRIPEGRHTDRRQTPERRPMTRQTPERRPPEGRQTPERRPPMGRQTPERRAVSPPPLQRDRREEGQRMRDRDERYSRRKDRSDKDQRHNMQRDKRRRDDEDDRKRRQHIGRKRRKLYE